jgi:hypothetical protein
MGAVVFNERFTTASTFSSCAGEPLAFELEGHLVIQETVDAQGVTHLGTTLIARFHATSASGVRYVGHERSTTHERRSLGTGAETFTHTLHLKVVRAGESVDADDLVLREVFHITEVDGEFVVINHDDYVECK